MQAYADNVVEEIHVGSPRGPLTDWVIKKVHFHEFAGLTTERDEEVRSPEFSCFGHQWMVGIYPGGEEDSKEGYVAVYLYNVSAKSIKAYYKIILKHPTDQSQRSYKVGSFDELSRTFGGDQGNDGDSWGGCDFAKRETMLTYLNNGTLTLEIHLRTNKQADPTSFVPSNPCSSNLLKGFNNEDKSDVIFEVSGETETAPNRRKRTKTASTIFHASHLILDLNAPALADMCRPGDEAAVPINGVEPEVFKMLLFFCYGGTVSEDELAANAKAIIEAADRFGIVNLKLQAEAVLTEQTEIAVDNMIDNLLYANSKNLALFPGEDYGLRGPKRRQDSWKCLIQQCS
ncbi:hypothetical protein THAOC_36336 [Thalassiosira oceanica]|uniref:MATH domain-containing protein n=1 Tax=Thalassiosira oceanica TaxID=159749 RepID=K0R0C4_THAOC|nr:hypothetical protein THAOC_36336 [Thalassiosira oceanica]|eukprot:EJK45070.1 hypothetical protein THAOC_36336 [Thalassiosira oceanica]